MIDRKKIIDLCRLEIGTSEHPKGSNKTKYGEWYKFNGVAWCAISVSYMLYQSQKIILNINKKYNGITGFSYVPDLHHIAKEENLFTNDPKPGDIVLYDFAPNDGREFAQHVGLFESKKVNGNINSFEGNTSFGEGGSQDNGDQWAYKSRNPKFILGIVCLEKLIASGHAQILE